MRIRRFLVPALLVLVTSSLAAHDLFLKLADFFVAPQSVLKVTALNGTFTTSENSIERKRIADISLVGPAGRTHLDTTAITAEGKRTAITVRTGAAGTYLLGLSIHPSQISLAADTFNTYLTDEGLGVVVAARRKAGELGRRATERYSKHVKLLFQAGAERTSGWETVLGYAAEIVPMKNPYTLSPGDTLPVRLVVDGAPAPAGQEAIVGGRTVTGGRLPEQHLMADANGVVKARLGAAGTWYVKFISMTRVTQPGVDYISQWATLTFAVRQTSGKRP